MCQNAFHSAVHAVGFCFAEAVDLQAVFVSGRN